MALCTAVVLATLAAEDDDLWSACLAHYGCADGGAFNNWRANCYLVAITKHHDIVENHLGTFLSSNTLHKDCVVFGNAVLLATCFHQRIHGDYPYLSVLRRKSAVLRTYHRPAA